MRIRQSGFINSVSTSIFLLLLLSLGLYMIALNPQIAGFEVQTTSRNTQTTTYRYQQPKATVSPASDEFITVDNSWGAESKQSGCDTWYEARKGDTQWDLAAQYATANNRWSWIKGMRQASGKPASDDRLTPGESICVSW